MKRVIIGLLFVVVVIIVFSTITKNITDKRIQERVAYWNNLTDSELPNGASKEEVKSWGIAHHLNHFSLVPGKDFYNANVEQVPDAGIGFPCSDWNIIVDIYIGSQDTVVKRDVHIVGSCV